MCPRGRWLAAPVLALVAGSPGCTSSAREPATRIPLPSSDVTPHVGTTAGAAPPKAGSAPPRTGLPTTLPVPSGTTVIARTSGSGSHQFDPVTTSGTTTSGTFDVQIACDRGSVRVIRKPDVDFRITCTGTAAGVSVPTTNLSGSPVTVETAARTRWTISAGMSTPAGG